MKFLICNDTDGLVDICGEEVFFKGQDGAYYNYQVELDEEVVRISDGIGRMVPVGIEDLDSLIKMLTRINSFVKNTESLNEYLYQKLIEGASV